MIRTYFKSVFRSTLKHKLFAAINLVGLSFALATFILIFLYVRNELSFDKYYQESEKIYRVSTRSHAFYSMAYLDELKRVNPAVKSVTSMLSSKKTKLVKGQKQNVLQNFYYSTDGYTNVFQHQYVYGDGARALSKPNSIIITESLSAFYFGDNNPVGEVLRISNQIGEGDYEVTAVIKDLPSTVSTPIEAIATFPEDFLESAKSRYSFTSFYSYFKTEQNYDLDELNKMVDQSLFDRDYIQYGDGRSQEEFREGFSSNRLIMPLEKIHLESNLTYEASQNGDYEVIYILSLVAVLIIILASINYITLSITSAQKRFKEVAIRSVLGATKSQVSILFFLESVIYCICSLIIGLWIAELSMKLLLSNYFEHYATSLLNHQEVLVVATLLALAQGVISGVFPFTFLMKIKPTKGLKSKFTTGPVNGWFKNTLVVFQLVVSLGLILFAVFISKQFNYGLTIDRGFDLDNVITVDNSSFQLGHNKDAFLNSLKSNSRVEYAGFTHFELTKMNLSTLNKIDGEAINPMTVSYVISDEGYPKALSFELVKGRFFDAERDETQGSVLINETLARELGGDVLGRKILHNLSDNGMTIVGVLKDFHYDNLRSKIAPVALIYAPYSTNLYISYHGDYDEALTEVNRIYSEFTDEILVAEPYTTRYEEIFKQDKQLGIIVNLFTVVAVIISVFGLIGLIAALVNQKFKEIGIRRVLGAPIVNILGALNLQLLRLLAVAMVLAFPLSVILIKQWLSSFAYRVSFSYLPFIVLAVGALMTVLVIVVAGSLKTVFTNPVDVLREE
ncbi:ABC transporter permease [Roseivirga sp.]|uniref:ABC transporter permease n=1 Tax=Roseivirga sp. TaxID=1964215 RepID=UPI003B5225C6